jgi:hypothetical protein
MPVIELRRSRPMVQVRTTLAPSRSLPKVQVIIPPARLAKTDALARSTTDTLPLHSLSRHGMDYSPITSVAPKNLLLSSEHEWYLAATNCPYRPLRILRAPGDVASWQDASD